MKALYVVVGVLGVALISFFMGSPTEGFESGLFNLSSHVEGKDDFFKVFAIVFPAFTGMTAGVGL